MSREELTRVTLVYFPQMAHQNVSGDMPPQDNFDWLDTVDLRGMDIQDDVCTKVKMKCFLEVCKDS